MTRRRRFADQWVKNLATKATRYAEPDPELAGHFIRVTPSGAKSFTAIARDPYGKQVWTTIESADVIGIEEARDRAREIIKRVKSGKAAVEPPPTKPDSFKAVAENWLRRYVAKKALISQREIERILVKYVLPYWGDRPFIEIQREDVARLLDRVEDRHGARQADYVLAVVSKLTNWFATRSSSYSSPVVRGMGRAEPGKRDRILTDDEIRIVWRQAETGGTFGAIVRIALLTAQRREKIAAMRRSDVADGTWTIPTEQRQKGAGGALVLPEIALKIIKEAPRVEGNAYVFPGRSDGHFNGFSPCKRAFDKKLPPLPHWTLHDLRRTARSLMSRSGVPSEIAERVLGHAIRGIESVYNRHDFRDEKADALRRLARLIETILNPPSGNVLPMRTRG
jgi:integrase